MKKLIILLTVFLLVASAAYAVSIGSASVSVNASTANANNKPYVFLDTDTRLMVSTEPGRVELIQRHGNYAFEGEQIRWDVLVWDRNGVSDITSVSA